MEKGLVSVIITTYQRPVDILFRAVSSASHQTYENIEILIVNDFPDEANSQLIKDRIEKMNDSRITYLTYETNRGACYARNYGLAHSNGAYIAFLDDDDVWLENKIETQIAGFTKSEIGLVYCPFINIDVKNGCKKELKKFGDKSGQVLEKLLDHNIIGGCSMPMIRREVFNNCGVFDEQFPSSQDYDMWIRISEQYEVLFIDEPLTIRYLLPVSITKNIEKKIKGWELLTEKHEAKYLTHPKIYNLRINRFVRVLIRNGYYKKAFYWWKKAILVYPFALYNLASPILGLLCGERFMDGRMKTDYK